MNVARSGGLIVLVECQGSLRSPLLHAIMHRVLLAHILSDAAEGGQKPIELPKQTAVLARSPG